MPAKPRRSAGPSKTSAKAASRRPRAKTPRPRMGAATSSPTATSPVAAAIAERAYYLYLERGASGGHALDDWLRAEYELRPEAVVVSGHAGPPGEE